MALQVCGGCGSRYAAGLPQCPHCSRTDYRLDYEQEAAPAAPAAPEGAEALPEPPPVRAPKADHVEYVASALGVPEQEAASLTKPELVDLARAAVEGGEQPSAGTGFSKSSETGSRSSSTGLPSLPSPAQGAGSPSSTPPPPTADPKPSSSAGTTDGSTPGTTSAPSGSED